MSTRVVKYKSRKRRKPRANRVRIAGIDLGTDVQLVILVGIGIGGYVLYNYLTSDSSSTNTNTGANTTAASDVAAQVAAGDGPNYDPTQYATWSSSIFQAGNTLVPMLSSPSVVLSIMDQLDNLADVYSLIAAFGTQQATGWSFSAQQYDLPGFIHAAFHDSDIASFNQQLGYNNVSYTF